MAKRAVSVKKAPVTWFLVADGKRAQVYSRRKTERMMPVGGNPKHPFVEDKTLQELVPVRGMRLEAESLDEYDFGQDQMGRTFESSSPTRHAVEPRMDVRDEVKLHFVHSIASKLAEKKSKKAFDRLVLIAPPKILGELKKRLEKSVRDAVVAELPKELTHYENHELAARLEGLGLPH